ncbi:Uncharacterised protein [Bordetella pertussis]|nr:Uncharacterised protein [Bordetella pertussis]
MLNESHSTRNEMALLQASTSIAPPLNIGLLARMPTGWPSRRATMVQMERPNLALSSITLSRSTMQSIALRTS